MTAGSHLLEHLLLLTLEVLEVCELLLASGEHDVIGGGLGRGEEQATVGRGRGRGRGADGRHG